MIDVLPVRIDPRLVEPFCRDNTGIVLEDGRIRVVYCGETIAEKEIGEVDTLSGLSRLLLEVLFDSIMVFGKKYAEITFKIYSMVYEELSNNWGE